MPHEQNREGNKQKRWGLSGGRSAFSERTLRELLLKAKRFLQRVRVNGEDNRWIQAVEQIGEGEWPKRVALYFKIGQLTEMISLVKHTFFCDKLFDLFEAIIIQFIAKVDLVHGIV